MDRSPVDPWHADTMAIPSTFSLPQLEHQLHALSAEIDTETNERRKDYLCAAYQALKWARNPDGSAPPSDHDASECL